MTSYLELSIERCRRNIGAIWPMSAFVLLETLFGLIIGNRIVAAEGRWTISGFLVSLAISIAIAISLLLAGQAIKRRRLQPQLDYLLNLQRQLSDADRP